MLGRKLLFRNIIPNDFDNTVEELVISWFFGFRSFFKIFLAGLMSRIRVRLMIWSEISMDLWIQNGLPQKLL
jgi:hypothetical protein